LCYGESNLRGAGCVAVNADGLRADSDFASIAGDDEASFHNAQGLPGGFGGIVD
jgi:hypothetical protein